MALAACSSPPAKTDSASPVAGADAGPRPTAQPFFAAPGDPLFIPHERIAAIKSAAAAETPEWRALRKAVDAHLSEPEFGESRFMNAAVVYLGTGDRRYCDRLGVEASRAMTTGNPRGDSYAVYAGYMQLVA